MPIPAAARLVDFSPLPGAIPALAAGRLFVSSKRKEDEQAERVAEAFQRGCAEGLSVGREAGERRLREAEAAFENRLAAARSLWADEQGLRFAERFEAAFAALGAEVRESVAAILTPFVEEALRQRMVDDLLRALEKVLRDGRPESLAISGPADVLGMIRKALGEASSAVAFEATDSVDVRVVADRTIIETQLAPWLQRVRQRTE